MSHAHSPTTMRERATQVDDRRLAFFDRLRRDEDGAVMVIAVFMAAVLVGALWYTWGLGEAMIYRQQLRQAVDAAAFDSAVVHALGMNMIAMMNITMAAIFSVLLALTVVFALCIVCTIIAVILLVIPGVDIVDAGGVGALLDIDETMYNLIKRVQPFVFKSTTALNAAEGSVAIIMPFAGLFASTQAASEYGGAVRDTGSFSSSMIPMRAPYYSNKLDSWLKDKLPTLPLIGQPAHPTRIPLLSRYGLPVQDDVFGILCMHAGMELIDELGLVVQGLTLNLVPIQGIEKPISQLFGMAVGTMPGLFCTGVTPIDMAVKLIEDEGVAIPKFLLYLVLPTYFAKGWGDAGLAKTVGKLTHGPEIFPMKPFDESSNGSSWNQVYGSATGSPTLGIGAITGVAVAGWTPVEATENSGAANSDFAEAEFYFDCGNPANTDDQTVVGTDDTDGQWQSCKYNAMWNMRWRTRMRRFHQFEWDIRKDIELSLFQGLGIDKFFQSILPPAVAGGSLAKTQLLDKIKACVTALGSGSTSGTGDFGGCPFPAGEWFSFPNGGKLGVGVGPFPSGTPDGYPMSAVLH